MITLEQVDEILAKAQLQVLELPQGDETFKRCRAFTVAGVEFHIEWWSNIGYLSTGPLTLPFDFLCLNAHSPRRSTSVIDLRFSFRGEHFGPVINLVDWVKA